MVDLNSYFDSSTKEGSKNVIIFLLLTFIILFIIASLFFRGDTSGGDEFPSDYLPDYGRLGN